MTEPNVHRFLRLWDRGEILATNEGRTLHYSDVADLMNENERLSAQLANPCNGSDCEAGGSIHCHACPEAEADRLIAERDDALAEVEQLRTRVADLEADRACMAAEKERFRRTIAIADDSCTCMAVFAARAKVRNEEDDDES
jgi:hypothetical protein